jgi:hypothetical protein
MILPALRDSCLFVCCLFVVGTDENCNFSAVRSPIELKLGGDLGLVFQISVHVLVLRFDYFLYCKQTKEQITLKTRFYITCVFSVVPSPIDLKLGRNIRTSTRNSVVCWICLYYCLFTFCKHNKENTLYG